jgi:hypothetical protein
LTPQLGELPEANPTDRLVAEYTNANHTNDENNKDDRIETSSKSEQEDQAIAMNESMTENNEDKGTDSYLNTSKELQFLSQLIDETADSDQNDYVPTQTNPQMVQNDRNKDGSQTTTTQTAGDKKEESKTDKTRRSTRSQPQTDKGQSTLTFKGVSVSRVEKNSNVQPSTSMQSENQIDKRRTSSVGASKTKATTNKK